MMLAAHGWVASVGAGDPRACYTVTCGFHFCLTRTLSDAGFLVPLGITVAKVAKHTPLWNVVFYLHVGLQNPGLGHGHSRRSPG